MPTEIKNVYDVKSINSQQIINMILYTQMTLD